MYKLPAGKYTIGDLCYVIPDEEWMNFLEDGLWKEQIWNGAVALSTAYGDGTYVDQYSREYPVDSGLIGVIPYKPEHDECFGVHFVEFSTEFEVYRDGYDLVFGNIVIPTDGTVSYEDDED